MKLKFRRSWKYSPHGFDVVQCDAGAVCVVPEGFGAIAISEGVADPVDGETHASETGPTAKPARGGRRKRD